jgi:tellurite resistance protein
MSNEFLEERRHSLEELFFAKKNQELMKRLKHQQETEEYLLALRVASGIQNEELLEKLHALGMHAETVAALSLVPLVEVAWADGEVAEREREAVLRAAHAVGIDPGGDAEKLLDVWLEQRPPAEVVDAWKQYISALASQLGEDALHALETEVMERAWRIAESAGGFLGAGAVSGKERDKLDELSRAFHHTS